MSFALYLYIVHSPLPELSRRPWDMSLHRIRWYCLYEYTQIHILTIILFYLLYYIYYVIYSSLSKWSQKVLQLRGNWPHLTIAYQKNLPLEQARWVVSSWSSFVRSRWLSISASPLPLQKWCKVNQNEYTLFSIALNIEPENEGLEMFRRWFSFSNRWFSGSMLIF